MSNRFKHMYSSNQKVAVIVPSMDKKGIPIDRMKYEIRTVRELTALFGGASSIKQVGMWLDDNGNEVSEVNSLVYSYTDKLDDDYLDEVYSIAWQLKIDMYQDSIAVIINDAMYFI